MRVEQKDIDRIKEIQLEMLKEVNDFCSKNDIKYSLAYGTLLGAIRHDGYIPWDDDIDIWMTRKDYNNFLKLFKSENNVVSNINNTKNYPFYMAKIINTKTKLVESCEEHVNFTYGVYIDIFVLDKLPKNHLISELKLARNYFLYSKLRLKFLKTNNKFIKFLQRCINPNKIYNKQEKLWKNSNGDFYKDDATLYFFHKNSNNKRYKFLIEDFNDLVDKKFENINCKIPKNYDKLLKQIYGNYMELPPVEKRAVHNFIYFKELE